MDDQFIAIEFLPDEFEFYSDEQDVRNENDSAPDFDPFVFEKTKRVGLEFFTPEHIEALLKCEIHDDMYADPYFAWSEKARKKYRKLVNSKLIEKVIMKRGR